MRHTVQESFIGNLLYTVSGHKILNYAEERDDFELPEKYRPQEKKPVRRASSNSQNTVVGEQSRSDGNKKDGKKQGQSGGKEEDDHIIVDWYSDDDQENPQNWSLGKKMWVTFTIMLMTSSIYLGSSIWSPGVQDGMQYFGVGPVPAALGITLFVFGYGIGPLFLSPITEIPQIGRTKPYIITLALFAILQVPTALVTNFAGFCVLRFLAGFIGSPPLATGGASLGDIFAPQKLPYSMGLYGLAAASAPALAPVIAGFAVQYKGWRWAFWEMLWVSGFSLVLLSFTLPETSAQNILLRRAQRLRRVTGNDKIKSQSEIDSAKMQPKDIVQMTLLRPIKMSFTEPIVIACDIYIGLVYMILYSYFESFPIVYAQGYGWSLGVSNLPFLALLVGSIISYLGFIAWNRFYFEPKFHSQDKKLAPERRLPMACLGAFCFPICLFWFAWTANRTHWISPVIASAFFGLGTTWMFMPILTYLPHCYPEYAASVLASNDFVRSMMGGAMPLVAHSLFVNLGIDWGNTLLGCLTVVFIPIPFILIRYGSAIRARSPMALHDEDIEEADGVVA